MAMSIFQKARHPSIMALLTNREQEIGDLLVSGLSVTQIAERLGMKPKSIYTSISIIRLKYDARDRDELIKALRNEPYEHTEKGKAQYAWEEAQCNEIRARLAREQEKQIQRILTQPIAG